MASIPSEVEHTTTAALEEKTKLQKHFGRFDMFFFLVCTLVGLDTIGAVANKGAQGFTWLIFLVPVFFVPYALLTSELGSSFTEEGGPYVWTKLALGRFVGGVNAIIYWLSNPIWLGGSLCITAVATFNAFFFELGNAKYVFGLLFIWISVWSAILSFGVGKWLPTIGAWGRMIVLGLFTVTVILYAFQHGVHGVGGGSFKPTYAAFIALVPVLFFNYVGFELPNAAGDEMKDPQKDVPFTVIRSAFMAVILYGVPILAILLVLPLDQVTSLGGFIDAMKTVFTVYGGHVGASPPDTVVLTGAGKVLGDLAAILFIFALMSSGATWIMGADRAQAVACYDGAGPRVLGRFSKRYGTPVAVNALSGIISSVFMILAFLLTSGSTAKYFSAALGLAISTTTISYLAIFPALYLLRRKMPDVSRPYRVPGGNTGALLISGLTFFWAALATAALLWPGLGQSNPDSQLPSGFAPVVDSAGNVTQAAQRWQYEASQFIPLALFFLLGVVFYALGAPTRRQEVAVPLAEPLTMPAGAE
jgi:glutamate:GABA antiporter